MCIEFLPIDCRAVMDRLGLAQTWYLNAWIFLTIVLMTLVGCTASVPSTPWAENYLSYARPEVVFHGVRRTSGWLSFSSTRVPTVFGQTGGRKVQVVLDSGAAVTLIDRALADRLGLKTAAAGHAIDASGLTKDFEVTQGFDLRLGDLELREIPAFVIDLATMRQLGAPASLEVVLGTQVFHTLVADIDFPGRRVALYKRETEPTPTDAVAIPIGLLPNTLGTVQVSVEGSQSRSFLFDTGADAELILFADAAEALGVLADRPIGVHDGVSIGGRVSVKHLTLRSVELAGLTIDDVHCDVIPSGIESEVGLSGIVGSGLLRDFRIILDYQGRRALVLP